MDITQKQIAELTGIARKTVSRYFNDPSKVAPTTRKKIQALCDQKNYMPNSAARSIRDGKFRRVACLLIRKIVKDQREGVFLHQLSYINGMSNVLSRNGFSLEISPIILDESHDRDIIFPQMFSEFCVDGIICLPPGPVYPEIREKLERFQLPSAWLNNKHPLDGWECLVFDEYASGVRLTQHLIDQGKREFVWLDTVPVDAPHYSQIERRQGMIDTLEKAGLRSDRTFDLILLQTAEEEAVGLFERYPEVDAVVSNVPFLRKSYEYMVEERKRPGMKTAYFATEWQAKDIMRNELCMVTRETELGERAAEYVLSQLDGSPREDLLVPLKSRLQFGGEFVD